VEREVLQRGARTCGRVDNSGRSDRVFGLDRAFVGSARVLLGPLTIKPEPS
jgi:hypothetical protein